jgi:hypothetical protein
VKKRGLGSFALHYEEKEAASALPFTRRPAGVAKLIA